MGKLERGRFLDCSVRLRYAKANCSARNDTVHAAEPRKREESDGERAAIGGGCRTLPESDAEQDRRQERGDHDEDDDG